MSCDGRQTRGLSQMRHSWIDSASSFMAPSSSEAIPSSQASSVFKLKLTSPSRFRQTFNLDKTHLFSFYPSWSSERLKTSIPYINVNHQYSQVFKPFNWVLFFKLQSFRFGVHGSPVVHRCWWKYLTKFLTHGPIFHYLPCFLFNPRIFRLKMKVSEEPLNVLPKHRVRNKSV